MSLDITARRLRNELNRPWPQTVSHQEIFQEAYQRLETQRFSHPLSRELSQHSTYARLLHPLGRFRPPWLLDDSNPRTLADADLRRRIDSIVTTQQRLLRRLGLRPGTTDYNSRLTNGLLLSLQLPRRLGGLGLRYVFAPDNRHHRLDALEAWRAGYGDCNSLSFIFYAMARRAGLHPRFIRISGELNLQTRRFDALSHVGVGISLDSSHPEQIAATDPSRTLRLNERDHRWRLLTPLEMMAHHLRNIALNNAPGNLSPQDVVNWREERLLEAAELAPNDEEIRNANGPR